jgi:hypothetical protein
MILLSKQHISKNAEGNYFINPKICRETNVADPGCLTVSVSGSVPLTNGTGSETLREMMLRTRGSGWIRIDFCRLDPDQAKMTHNNEQLEKNFIAGFSLLRAEAFSYSLDGLFGYRYFDVSL